MERNDQYSGSKYQSAFQEIDDDDFDKKYDMQKILRGMQRFIPLVVVITLIFGGLGGYYTWYNLTNYKAKAFLLYHEGVISKDDQSAFNVNELTLPTTVDLIMNPSHIEAIISILGLDMEADELSERISVPTPAKQSAVIQIVAEADNPNFAIDVANTLARVSVRSARDYLQNQFNKSMGSFKKELNEVNNKLAGENKEIENFKQKNQYLEMGADYNMLITDMLAAKEQLESAKVEYDSLLVQYENLKRGMGNLPESVAVNIDGASSPYASKILELKALISDAKTRYTDKNPKVLRLQEQLNDLLGHDGESEAQGDSIDTESFEKPQTNIELMKMQATVRAAQKRKEYLEERLKDIEEAVKDVPSEQMKLAKLLHNKEITEGRLQRLQVNYNRILQRLNNPTGNLELYISAEKTEPKNDKLLTYIMPLVGIVFGLIIGALLAFILETLDTKLRTKKQIELNYTLPLFSLIPQIKNLKKRNSEKKLIYFMRQISDRLLNLERKLRGQKQSLGSQGICVGILSCNDGEGKSTIIFELANYLDKINKKVVLLELDPKTYSGKRGSSEQSALSSYLSGDSEIEDLIEEGNPHIVKLGNPSAGLTEHVKSGRLETLVKHLKERFEYVLIDVPGILEEEFGMYVAGLCDSTIFLIDSSQTPKSTVDVVLEELEGMEIISDGIILNNVSKLYIDSEKLLKEMKIANRI